MDKDARIAALESALRAARLGIGQRWPEAAALLGWTDVDAPRTTYSAFTLAAIDAALAGSGEDGKPEPRKLSPAFYEWARRVTPPDTGALAAPGHSYAIEDANHAACDHPPEDMICMNCGAARGQLAKNAPTFLAVARAALDEAARKCDEVARGHAGWRHLAEARDASDLADRIRAIDPAAIVAKVRG